MKLLLRLSPLALLLIATIPSRAQTVRDVISFTGQNQSGDPAMIPTQGRDGQLYGTSPNPRDTDGSDFRLSLGGELTVLYEFGSSANGVQPYAGITLGTDGNFYGTTSGGGSGQYGTLYKVTPRGVLTTLHSFSGQSDGSSPASAPTEGADGNFYGTTAGNAGNPATIYKYSPSSGSVTTIYQFDASHGEEVNSPLIQASDGYLYGVAVHGGASSLGTVFKISHIRTDHLLPQFHGQGKRREPVWSADRGLRRAFLRHDQLGRPAQLWHGFQNGPRRPRLHLL